MRTIIVGCGRVGGGLAGRLARAGDEVTIIDLKTDAFDRLPEGFPGNAVRADGTDEDVLRRIGIEGSDRFFALTEGDNRNILARRLWGEDADLLSIAETLKSGGLAVRHMDAGEANGRLFFVGASFGMVPHLARARERLRGRAEPSGLWPAFRHVMRLGRRGILRPRIAYTLPSGDTRRCAGLMVSVKSIDEMLFRPGEKADPASFDCAAATPSGWIQLVWLALRAVFTDTWRSESMVSDFNVPHLLVTGRNPLIVALDGEAVALEPPVTLTMLFDPGHALDERILREQFTA